MILEEKLRDIADAIDAHIQDGDWSYTRGPDDVATVRLAADRLQAMREHFAEVDAEIEELWRLILELNPGIARPARKS